MSINYLLTPFFLFRRYVWMPPLGDAVLRGGGQQQEAEAGGGRREPDAGLQRRYLRQVGRVLSLMPCLS